MSSANSSFSSLREMFSGLTERWRRRSPDDAVDGTVTDVVRLVVVVVVSDVCCALLLRADIVATMKIKLIKTKLGLERLSLCYIQKKS